MKSFQDYLDSLKKEDEEEKRNRPGSFGRYYKTTPDEKDEKQSSFDDSARALGIVPKKEQGASESVTPRGETGGAPVPKQNHAPDGSAYEYDTIRPTNIKGVSMADTVPQNRIQKANYLLYRRADLEFKIGEAYWKAATDIHAEDPRGFIMKNSGVDTAPEKPDPNDMEAIREHYGIREMEERLARIETVNKEDMSFIDKMGTGAAEMLPLWKRAAQKGGVTAGLATVGGLVTGGASLGLAVGAFKAGSAYSMMQIEGGLAYKEAREAGIDHETAVAMAVAVGGLNAAIEYAQVGMILKNMPAGKAGLRTVIGEMRKKTFPTLLKLAPKYAGIVASETGEEVAQEFVTLVGVELAKNWDNATKGTSLEGITLDELDRYFSQTPYNRQGQQVTAGTEKPLSDQERMEIELAIDRLGDTAVETLPTMMGIGLIPGAVKAAGVATEAATNPFGSDHGPRKTLDIIRGAAAEERKQEAEMDQFIDEMGEENAANLFNALNEIQKKSKERKAGAGPLPESREGVKQAILNLFGKAADETGAQETAEDASAEDIGSSQPVAPPDEKSPEIEAERVIKDQDTADRLDQNTKETFANDQDLMEVAEEDKASGLYRVPYIDYDAEGNEVQRDGLLLGSYKDKVVLLDEKVDPSTLYYDKNGVLRSTAMNENDLVGTYVSRSLVRKVKAGAEAKSYGSVGPTSVNSQDQIGAATMRNVTIGKKVKKLAAAMKKHGWKGEPLLAILSSVNADGTKEIALLTGSHRYHAAETVGIDIPLYELDEAALEAYLEKEYGDQGINLSALRGMKEEAQIEILKGFDEKAAALLEAEIAHRGWDEKTGEKAEKKSEEKGARGTKGRQGQKKSPKKTADSKGSSDIDIKKKGKTYTAALPPEVAAWSGQNEVRGSKKEIVAKRYKAMIEKYKRATTTVEDRMDYLVDRWAALDPIAKLYPKLAGTIRQMAERLLADLGQVSKPESVLSATGVNSGDFTRLYSDGFRPALIDLLNEFEEAGGDRGHETYAQYEKALKEIIEGKTKTALAKRIETFIHKVLVEGYQDDEAGGWQRADTEYKLDYLAAVYGEGPAAALQGESAQTEQYNRHKTLIDTLLSHPLFGGLKVVIQDEEVSMELSRKELEKKGYHGSKSEKNHTIIHGRYDPATDTVIINGTATKETVIEEFFHAMQERICRHFPDLAQEIAEWEADVLVRAEQGGAVVPGPVELLAKAYIYTELGHDGITEQEVAVKGLHLTKQEVRKVQRRDAQLRQLVTIPQSIVDTLTTIFAMTPEYFVHATGRATLSDRGSRKLDVRDDGSLHLSDEWAEKVSKVKNAYRSRLNMRYDLIEVDPVYDDYTIKLRGQSVGSHQWSGVSFPAYGFMEAISQLVISNQRFLQHLDRQIEWHQQDFVKRHAAANAPRPGESGEWAGKRNRVRKPDPVIVDVECAAFTRRTGTGTVSFRYHGNGRFTYESYYGFGEFLKHVKARPKPQDYKKDTTFEHIDKHLGHPTDKELEAHWGEQEDLYDMEVLDLYEKVEGPNAPWRKVSEHSYGPESINRTELVDVGFLMAIQEFDRSNAAKHPGGPKRVEEVAEMIRKEGLKQPLLIIFNRNTGYMYIGEGNHRLAALAGMGATKIPAFVSVEDYAAPGSNSGGLFLSDWKRTGKYYQKLSDILVSKEGKSVFSHQWDTEKKYEKMTGAQLLKAKLKLHRDYFNAACIDRAAMTLHIDGKISSAVWRAIREADRDPSYLFNDLDRPGIDLLLQTMMRLGQVSKATYYDHLMQRAAWEMDAFDDIYQDIESTKTSINATKTPAVFGIVDKKIGWKPGTVNLDVGGGRYDTAAEFLGPKEVENLVYDPYNRTDQENRATMMRLEVEGLADTATVSNVLNVIREPLARLQVLVNAARGIKPEGTAYIKIWEGDKSGEGKRTASGWQENRRTADYVEEVETVFADVKVKHGLIIAKKPYPKESFYDLEVIEETEEPFYSLLYNTLNEKIQGRRATVEQVRGIVEKSRVTKAELEWTGFLDMLSLHAPDEKLTKEEFLNLASATKLQIREIRLGAAEALVPLIRQYPMESDEAVMTWIGLLASERTFNFRGLFFERYTIKQGFTSAIMFIAFQLLDKPAMASLFEGHPYLEAVAEYARLFADDGAAYNRAIVDMTQHDVANMMVKLQLFAEEYGAIMGSKYFVPEMGSYQYDSHYDDWNGPPEGTEDLPATFPYPLEYEEADDLDGAPVYRSWMVTDNDYALANEDGNPISGSLYEILCALEMDTEYERDYENGQNVYGDEPYARNRDTETGFDRYTENQELEDKVDNANYQEHLYVVDNPKNEKPWIYSPHWGERQNVVAHVRMSDKTTPDGKKVLYLEELQSDWHQQGRDYGYATPENIAEKREITDEVVALKNSARVEEKKYNDAFRKVTELRGALYHKKRALRMKGQIIEDFFIDEAEKAENPLIEKLADTSAYAELGLTEKSQAEILENCLATLQDAQEMMYKLLGLINERAVNNPEMLDNYRESAWRDLSIKIDNLIFIQFTHELSGKYPIIEQIGLDSFLKDVARKYFYRIVQKDYLTEWVLPVSKMEREYNNFQAEEKRAGDAMVQIQKTIDGLKEVYSELNKAVPFPAPLHRTDEWVGMCVRRAIRNAVKGGYDYIALSPGEVQAKRWHLGTYVKYLKYDKESQKLTAIDPVTNSSVNSWFLDEKALIEQVGKEDTKKLLEEGFIDYRDEKKNGAMVGKKGRGMANFYNSMVPKLISKYIKRWKSRVGVMEVIIGQEDAELWTEKDDAEMEKLRADLWAARQEHKRLSEEYRTRHDISSPVQFDRRMGWYMPPDAISLRHELDEAKARVDELTALEMERVAAKEVSGFSKARLGFPVTDAMKEDVLTKGQPLYDLEVVENAGNLVVTHGLNIGKLESTLEKYGGFVMPSIAISHQENPLVSFGDIIMVGTKETIDPERLPTNLVFAGDAYTPMHPEGLDETYDEPTPMSEILEEMLTELNASRSGMLGQSSTRLWGLSRKQLNSIEEIRAASNEQLSRTHVAKEDLDYIDQLVNECVRSIFGDIAVYKIGFEAYNRMYKAVWEAYKSGARTDADIIEAFEAAGFKPEEARAVVQPAGLLFEYMAEFMNNYFEAKPARLVKPDEFAGILIPEQYKVHSEHVLEMGKRFGKDMANGPTVAERIRDMGFENIQYYKYEKDVRARAKNVSEALRENFSDHFFDLEYRAERKGIVGKRIGSTTWIHKSLLPAMDEAFKELVRRADDAIPDHYFQYDIIKHDRKTGNISLISSPDFDAAHEPVVGGGWVYRADGSVKYVPGRQKNPQIYHHKWLMVADDYEGFDAEAAKRRSEEWMNSGIPYDKRRIGNRDYWEQEVLSKLGRGWRGFADMEILEEAFADSLLRDKDGSLLPVYHGGAPVQDFDTTLGTLGRYGAGTYFSDFSSIAAWMGKEKWETTGEDVAITKAYLDIRRPFDQWGNKAIAKTPERDALEKLLRAKGFTDKQVRGAFGEQDYAVANPIHGMTFLDPFQVMAHVLDGGAKEANALLREAGYDSIIGKWRGSKEIVVFRPEMVGIIRQDPLDMEWASDGLYDLEESPYRDMIPGVRGGWTVAKVEKRLKALQSDYGKLHADRTIETQFDSPEELAERLYYHGTGGYIPRGLRPGSAIDKNAFRGGGYDEKYHAISLSRSRNTASNFTGQEAYGTVYPVILKKGAKVVERPDWEDSIDIEDELLELWKQGVDAVKIGDWDDEFSEQELAVLNPRAIVLLREYGKRFRVFRKGRIENLSMDEIREIYNVSKERWKNREEEKAKRLKGLLDLEVLDKNLTESQQLTFLEEDDWQRRIYDWIGAKDVRTLKNDVAVWKLQDMVRQIAGEKHFGKKSKRLDMAIQLYIDLKLNGQDMLEKYYDQLTKEQQELVDMSQNLPEQALGVADAIVEIGDAIGRQALEVDVLHNLREYHLSRFWKPDTPKSRKGHRGLARFGTKTGLAKARTLESILEGWAMGKELAAKGATTALSLQTDSLIRAIEDRRFLQTAMKMKDLDGNPLVDTYQHEGYEAIDHPNFRVYKWAAGADILRGPLVEGEFHLGDKVKYGNTYGKIEARNEDGTVRVWFKKLGEAKDLELDELVRVRVKGANFFMDDEGNVFERKTVYASEKIAKSLNKIMNPSDLYKHDWIRRLTVFGSTFKQIILFTSFFHHLAFVRSYDLGGSKDGLGTWNPIAAYKMGLESISGMDQEIRILVRNGLTLGRVQEWEENPHARMNAGRVSKWVNATKATREVKDTIIDLKERQTNFLFKRFGAGLKAMAALIEFKHMLAKNQKYIETGQTDKIRTVDDIAKMVANLINDDFGGLHLQRMKSRDGTIGRDQTTQHILRLALLAPDWTESNVRSMVKAIGTGDAVERGMYRRFWLRTYARGILLTVLANAALSVGDGDDEPDFFEKYLLAWKAGGLRWLDVDITRLCRHLGYDGEDRKYFSFIGHFKDVIKFLTPSKMVANLKHKGSVPLTIAIDAFTGTDWKGQRFTTVYEMLGADYNNTLYGETKVGKKRFTLTTWDGAGSHPLQANQIPSFLISEGLGLMPVQVQQILAFARGEQDAIDTIGNAMGLGFKSTYGNPSWYPAYNEWGEERHYYPGSGTVDNISRILGLDDDIEKHLIYLFEKSGEWDEDGKRETKHIPKGMPQTFTIDGQRVTVPNKLFSELSQKYGLKLREKYEQLFASGLSYLREETQVERLAKVLRDVNREYKEEVKKIMEIE